MARITTLTVGLARSNGQTLSPMQPLSLFFSSEKATLSLPTLLVEQDQDQSLPTVSLLKFDAKKTPPLLSSSSASSSSSSTEPGRVVGRVNIPSRASEPQFPFWQQTWFIALLLAMAMGFLCLAVFLFLGLDLDTGYAASASTPKAEGVEITYGSVLKLMHEKTKFWLHTHDVPYGSGSGHKSVTGFPNVNDANSYWVVGRFIGEEAKKTGGRRGVGGGLGVQIRLGSPNTAWED